VIACFLVAGFIESPDQLLKDVAHLDIIYYLRVKINFTKLGYDKIQTVSFIELGNVLFKAKVIEDLAGFGGEPFDVVGQVSCDVVGVTLKLSNVNLLVLWKYWSATLFRIGSRFLTLPPWRLSNFFSTSSLVGSSTQSSRRSTVMGSIMSLY
jgi:hypothetical protein